ncbi:MAG: hypothetical protein VSS52_006840 [Thiotrichaceae bacterium]|nr:hypothetical protein [Thiotrichaceae bacterium]
MNNHSITELIKQQITQRVQDTGTESYGDTWGNTDFYPIIPSFKFLDNGQDPFDLGWKFLTDFEAVVFVKVISNTTDIDLTMLALELRLNPIVIDPPNLDDVAIGDRAASFVLCCTGTDTVKEADNIHSILVFETRYGHFLERQDREQI